MIFKDLPAGADVFLDANTLVYHFGTHPVFKTPCEELLDRIDQRQFRGYTSAHVLSEMAHKLMIVEIMTLRGWPPSGIASRLRRHPAEVQQLRLYRQAIDELGLVKGLTVLDGSRHLVSLAVDLSRQYGLLSGDALIVSTMQQNRLTHLASNDPDFDRVPGLIRYAPS